MSERRLFLSLVSDEFRSYRELLTKDLERGCVKVETQEKWGTLGETTLEKLDTFIEKCDAVIHVVGDGLGHVPPTAAVDALLARHPGFLTFLTDTTKITRGELNGCSYTQWEAYLAIFHKRRLHIYRADANAPREVKFAASDAEKQSQQAHFQRIRDLGRDRDVFLNQERLSSFVLADLNDILPGRAARFNVPPTKLRHTAEVLIGRETELAMLDEAWNDPRRNVLIVRGIGGEGKTSLVASWMAELALKDWRGAEWVFDWSFYSQGTSDQSSATAELFIYEALKFFGDPDPNLGGPDERAARLAKLVGERKGLLVLDGLEPLQYPPGPLHGRLKDPGMATLLRGLAGMNHGLCVVTTREKVDEIQQHYGKSAIDHDLTHLSDLAGAALLHRAGATRAGAATIKHDDEELQAASQEVRGHALTLFLVGQYLKLTEEGDIRHRDRMKLADADHEYQNDATRPYGHAFKAIEAYETWFAAGDQQARRQLAVLRLLGLFDRPAPADCLAALRKEPVIDGLTELLTAMSDRDWRLILGRLKEINLVDVTDAGFVDCHPLIREYFATRQKANHPEAFRAAHSRLFDHLCEATPYRPDGLTGLQPLYQAVTHGCLAGRQQEACEKVYRDRILRGTGHDGYYSTMKLGATGADLGAVAAFFDEPWSRLSPNLSPPDQAWLLAVAAFNLRALGRLTEAVEPMLVGLNSEVQREDWKNAAISANNLSELELTLGRLTESVSSSRLAIEFADKSLNANQMMLRRTTAGDALFQSGDRTAAAPLFAEAERMQASNQPEFPLLYSVQGFQYCDLLLGPAERAAWQSVAFRSAKVDLTDANLAERKATIDEAELRATQTLAWVAPKNWLLDIALDRLTIARGKLYRWLLLSERDENSQSEISNMKSQITIALARLRKANIAVFLPQALLTAAFHAGAVEQDFDAAQRFLTEAQLIAERGPMPLYLADIHLHRARLFASLKSEVRRVKYPNIDPKEELAKARVLIECHGYGRRKEELEDAEVAFRELDGKGT